ncbi:uncharacterized protein Tco025E_06426, partial [Trypanosoma conorhini]
MIERSRRVVPGTQLCHRALYATIVGDQPQDCLPGTSVKMSSEGPILVDHVMRAARRYVAGNAPPAPESGPPSAMATELLRAVEELRQQNQQYQQELEARTQQLEARKQEVQALQNKLRVVHMEARRRGYNFHEIADRGSSRGSENRKTHETERPYSRRDFTPPRGTRGGGGAGGSGEYSRPPLPPLRVDSALVPSLPPPLPSLPPQLQPSCPPPLCGQEAQLAANDGVAAAVAKPPLPQLLAVSQSRGVAGDALGGGGGGVVAAVAKPPLPQLLLEESVRENGEAAEAELED